MGMKLWCFVNDPESYPMSLCPHVCARDSLSDLGVVAMAPTSSVLVPKSSVASMSWTPKLSFNGLQEELQAIELEMKLRCWVSSLITFVFSSYTHHHPCASATKLQWLEETQNHLSMKKITVSIHIFCLLACCINFFVCNIKSYG